jgi:hypothetical protein
MDTTTTTQAPEKPKHPLLQWRPKDGKANVRDAFYSPSRDLAYVGPEIIKRAVCALREELWEPWLAEVMLRNDVNEKLLIDTEAPLKLAKAVNSIIKEETPPAAMAASGFDALPGAIQLLFYARIGQVLLAATWSAVKDIHAPDSAPPATLQDILDAAEDALPEQLRGQ